VRPFYIPHHLTPQKFIKSQLRVSLCIAAGDNQGYKTAKVNVQGIYNPTSLAKENWQPLLIKVGDFFPEE